MGLIRLILALTVVYGHLHIYIPGFKSFGNEVAVQTFFVISGFYMTLVLNEKYLPKPGIYWAFIKNRILRLYPSYAVVCVVSLVIGLILASNGHPTEFFKAWSGDPVTANFGTKALAAITHFTIIGQDLPLFMAQDAGGAMYWTANFQQAPYGIWKLWINPPAWSLGLELMFYSIAPFLVRRSLKQVVPIILACYLLRMVIKYYFHLGDDPWSYRFFPTELSSFLLGTVAYHIYKKKVNMEWIKGKESAIIAAGIAALMLAPYIPHFKALFYP
ncbi:MAG: acyltransferase, partial [Armatimonadetes bacterium]|nr:acyltransferase [Armatimonadota bacterium]